MRRRVAITGIGLVSPLGLDTTATWQRALKGESAIRPFESFDASRLRTRFGGEVRGFDPSPLLSRQELRRSDRYTQLTVGAADQAVKDSGLEIAESEAFKVGVLLGVALGGLSTLEDNHRTLLARGPAKLSPMFVPMMLANTAPGALAMRYGALGPNYTLTSACASGAHAIGESAELIARGQCSAVLAGGTESTLTELCVGGFCAMHALSTRNDDPSRASRPFSAERDGFVISEGSCVLVLEDFERASRRGANIYAEILGYGKTCDAHHATAPHPEGRGVLAAMRQALQSAEVGPEQVGHVNAHATSTPAGDVCEALAIAHLLGPEVPVTAPKSMIGHTLGAAGAIEAALTALSLREQVIPPTLNQESLDPRCTVRVVRDCALEAPMTHALSNSFGFGGTNVSLLLGHV